MPALRFILQPIVENAILHGLSRIPGKGTLEILISREKDMPVNDRPAGDRLVIKIEDDGIGMPPEEVEALNQYINSEGKAAEENKHSIGIRNVNQRIKLACGNEYGITVKSIRHQGSSVVIRLPMISKGGEG